MLLLVAESAALVHPMDAVNNGIVAQPSDSPKHSQIGLCNRSRNPEGDILIHSVDCLVELPYIMDQDVVPHPPVTETLFAQPTFQTIEIIPFSWFAAGAVQPSRKAVHVDHHRPRVRMLLLVAESAALVHPMDAVNNGIVAQPSDSPKHSQIGLCNRSRNPEGDILIHSVDCLVELPYIMDHDVIIVQARGEFEMTNKVAPVPKGFKTVTPCLMVRGVEQALEFYTAAFGAKETRRLYNAEGTWILHAELKIGNSVIILTEENPLLGVLSPASLGGSATHGHIYIRSVDEFVANALDNGARVLTAVTDTYWGDRMATLVDPFGHVWTVASRIENLSDEDIAERAKAGLEAIPQEISLSELAA